MIATISATVTAALITGAVALAVAAIGGVIGLTSRNRQRRRDLYSHAYEAAMGWREMVYRVRRRDAGADADKTLIDRFHVLQEKLDYYQGWIGSESPWMGRSYCQLIDSIKRATRQPILDAWAESERRKPSEASLLGDEHPNCKMPSDRFLFDVRCHLTWFLPFRILVVWRNRKWFGGVT